MTRSAVWKAAKVLRDLGVSMEAVRNRGYRIKSAGEPLDATLIRTALPSSVHEIVRTIDVHWSIDSTNSALVARPNPPEGQSEVVLAEFQTAGRGRRGRQWIAPPGGSICMSLSWTFPQLPKDVGALSLAVGVCVVRALASLGVKSTGLKWPNDIFLADHKLGGVLIELRAESGGPACAVVGIGLNVALGAALLDKIRGIGLPATDLASVGIATPSRNAIAARLLEYTIRGLVQFGQEGLRPFVEEWRQADALRGRPVTVQGGEAAALGLARGIDISGALMVETPQGLRKFISGDVSVRPVA